VRTINTTERFKKLDLSFRYKGISQNISVVFEHPIEMFWFYRVFRKPTGRYIAVRDMSDKKSNWVFVGSVNLSQIYPGVVL